MGTAFDSTKKHNQGSTAQEPASAPAGASSHSSSPSSLLEEGERHVTRTVIKLAWPSILEQLLISMATLADTAMVGSIGASATAAVAVNISSVWLINGFITALSVGCSYLAAHAVGSGSVHRTHSVTYQSITCSLILGLLLFFGVELVCRPLPIWLGAAPDVVPMAQSYMRVIGFGLIPQSVAVVLSSLFRSAGDTRTPLAANLTSNMANIIGNFFLIYPARDVVLGGRTIFIWGAGLGVTGAAISTAASQYLLFFILLWFLSHKDTPVRIPLLRPRYRIQRRVFRQLWHIQLPRALGASHPDLRADCPDRYDFRAGDRSSRRPLPDQPDRGNHVSSGLRILLHCHRPDRPVPGRRKKGPGRPFCSLHLSHRIRCHCDGMYSCGHLVRSHHPLIHK